MNPILNPFAPGAGTPPPELAGRDELRTSVRIAVERIRRGLPTNSVIMVGLRGVGKTVLLDRMRDEAEEGGVQTVRIEAEESRSLPALLAPQLRLGLLRFSRQERAKRYANRALRALAGFAGALKVKYKDIEVGLDLAPEPGLADNGDLENDLPELLLACGEAAQRAETALILFVDEMQYVASDQFAVLIKALHRCAQRKSPIGLVGAGLPQLRVLAASAKTYAERLFEFPEVGALSDAAAAQAIAKPVREQGVEIADDAVSAIVRETKGYPYFLQEWGKRAWDAAEASPITVSDVRAASKSAIAALDESFFRVRFDRLTPVERRYLRAMAELGAGPHRSGDIAERLGRKVTGMGPTRSQLIAKGMIWSPSHGDTAFTVPLFDEFMRRIMPGDDWRS